MLTHGPFFASVCTQLCQYVNMGVQKWLEKSAEKQKYKMRKTLNPLSHKAFLTVSFSATKDIDGAKFALLRCFLYPYPKDLPAGLKQALHPPFPRGGAAPPACFARKNKFCRPGLCRSVGPSAFSEYFFTKSPQNPASQRGNPHRKNSAAAAWHMRISTTEAPKSP